MNDAEFRRRAHALLSAEKFGVNACSEGCGASYNCPACGSESACLPDCERAALLAAGATPDPVLGRTIKLQAPLSEGLLLEARDQLRRAADEIGSGNSACDALADRIDELLARKSP